MPTKFPKAPEWIKQLFDEHVAAIGAERKFMFGCPVGFVDGKMSCGVFGDTIFVRVSDDERARLLAMEGAAPFDPMGRGRPMSSYTVLPPDVLDDDRELRAWLERAVAWTATLPEKPAKRASKAAPAKAAAAKPAKKSAKKVARKSARRP